MDVRGHGRAVATAGRLAPQASGDSAGPDPSWRPLYRTSALAAAAFIVLTIASIVVAVLTRFPMEQPGTLPDTAATLAYIGHDRTAFIVNQILIQTPFMLTAATFMALCAALKHLDGRWAAIGALLAIGSIVASLDYLTIALGLVRLDDQLVAATAEPERAALNAAATALLAQYNAPSLTALLWPAGILVISIPMLRGVFPRAVAYLGLMTGAAGVVVEAARAIVGGAYGAYGVLLLAWTAAVAWKLYRLGRDPSA
jgi:hypothetical protein